MHLIIKRPYLEKIKSYLQVISKEFHDDSILIKTSKDSLIFFLASSNANSYIRIELILNAYLDIKSPGEVFINSKILSDLLVKLDISKDLEIYHADKNYLQFFSGSYECDLVILNNKSVKEVNIPQEISGCKPIIVPYEIFKESYLRLKDFCKHFEDHLIINSVLTNIHFRKNKDSSYLEIWASDAYRAVCGEFKLNTQDEFQLNLHPSTIALLIGIYAKQSSINLYLVESGEYLICSKEGCTIKTKINNSPYPSFIQWFNIADNTIFRVSKQELLNVIDRNLLLPNKNSQVALYKVESDSLLVEYKNNEKGKCREFIEIKGNDVPKVEFYLNNLLLKGLVRTIDSEEIVFKIHDSLKPIVLLSSVDSNFKQFILPARNV